MRVVGAIEIAKRRHGTCERSCANDRKEDRAGKAIAHRRVSFLQEEPPCDWPLACCSFPWGSPWAARHPPSRSTPSDNATIVRGDNQFAVDLYAQLDREQPGKNLFFSPTSISMALAMTAAGARGPTQSEMAKVLHLDADLAQAHAHYHQLLEQWNAVGQKRAYQLRVANRLWGQKGFPIRPEFLALTRQQYGAEMLLVDFAQAEAASREINQLGRAADQRQDQGPHPAADRSMPSTRLVLTNAVYFKGDWVQPFDKRNTQEEDFAVSAQDEGEGAADAPAGEDGLRGGGNVPGAGASVRGPGTVDGRALAEEGGRVAGVGEGDHGRQARLADVEAARPRGQRLPAQVQAGDFLRAEPDA